MHRRPRALYFAVFTFLTTFGHARDKTFSMPDSVLLFGNYEQGLILRVPGSSPVLIHRPSGTVHSKPVAVASLGLAGEHIAWGFPVADHNSGSPGVRCAVGVYSVRSETWQTYGDFSAVIATAISPDESQVAFYARRGSGSKVENSFFLLNTTTGEIRKLSELVPGSFSWSPDGKNLVTDSGVMNISTGSVGNIIFFKGHSPSWSPSGEWIAYIDSSKQGLRLVHPDGTGDHALRTVKNHLFGYRFFALNPVWSPDSTTILLNQYKGDGDKLDVVMVDAKTGATATKSTDANPILGWVSLRVHENP